MYVHIPFCERLCPYCDFAVSVQVDIPHQEYTRAVCEELNSRYGELGEEREVETIYFGGGTPSLLAPEKLEALIEHIRRLVTVTDDVEITLEANPNQISSENLAAWREIGINRLSLGCQSFQDRHLHRLRRNHDGAQALEAARLALSQMERVSVDLMFAGPDQSLQEWEADLGVMQGLVKEEGLDHVSAYNLTIEPGTTFAIRKRQGLLEVPGDDTAAIMLDRLVEACAEVGLARYEVSNFAIPGGESRHNSGYWVGRPYLGVGVGAHSLQVDDEGRAVRRANPKRYDEYMRAPGRPATEEKLSAQTHLGERLFLSARTTMGVDLKALRRQFPGISSRLFDEIDHRLSDLVDRGWMERRADSIVVPTNRGLNFADSLAQWLYEAA